MKRRSAPATGGALAGLALGAFVSYWLDPLSGRRRRAYARDKVIHAAHKAGDAVEKTGRDLSHRARGAVADIAAVFTKDDVEDRVLTDRVRSELGRVCSHPGAIAVCACDGVVELRGQILKSELKDVIREVGKVRGVHRVVSRLEVYKRPGDIPALQGGAGRRERRIEYLQTHWAPAPRFFAGTLGVALVTYGLSRRTVLGTALGAAGLVLFARSATNLELRRLFGIGAGRRAIEIQKELHIDAPVDQVFAFWRTLENFPRFMLHVKEVRPIDDRRYHWKVEGPVGASFEWDGEISSLVPNELLAWRSAEGAIVRNAGIVRFERENGGTRVNVRLAYNPPAGAIGHAFATLLGRDPKREMDDDLLRFKSLLETGKTTGRDETVTKGDMG